MREVVTAIVEAIARATARRRGNDKTELVIETLTAYLNTRAEPSTDL